MLTLNEQEETDIDKIMLVIADYIQIKPMQIASVSAPSLLGFEAVWNMDSDIYTFKAANRWLFVFPLKIIEPF